MGIHTTSDVKELLETYQDLMKDYMIEWKIGKNKNEAVKRFNNLYFSLENAYQILWEGLNNE